MRFSFYPLLLLLILFSCKRETLSLIPPDIEIGTRNGMEIKTIENVLISVPQIPETLSLDINNDGEDDISYSIRWHGSAGTGFASKHTLSLLNDKVSFLGIAYDDTTYLHYDTIIYTPGGGKVEIKQFKKYIFSKINSSDSFVSINHYPFKIKAMDSHDILRHPANFGKNETVLYEDNPDQLISSWVSNDTTYDNYINSIIHSNPYPIKKEIYFGFKFNGEGQSKLGWLKFMIFDNVTARIIETAIQKN